MKKLLLLLLFTSCYNDNDVKTDLQPQTLKIITHDTFEDILITNTEKSAVINTSSISPTVVTGGTLDTLTIVGSGFGTEKNKISWGGTHQTVGWQIPYWSDTKIKAIIPSNARTGQVKVLTSFGTEVGAGNLTVRYGIYNTSGVLGDSWKWYRFSHVDNSGIVFYTPEGTPQSFRDDFKRALEAWTCRVGIDWILSDEYVPAGTNHTNQPNGVSIAYLGWSPGCASVGISITKCEGINEFYVKDITIIFDGCKDYKTMLHELGHALLLTHNYNGGSIMSPTGGKEIGDIDIEAGKEVMRWNLIDNVSCQNIISKIDCDVIDPVVDPDPVVNYNKQLKVRFNKLKLYVNITGDFYVDRVEIEGDIIQLPRKKKFTIPFDYPKGVYVLTFYTDNGKTIIKKVKKR